MFKFVNLWAKIGKTLIFIWASQVLCEGSDGSETSAGCKRLTSPSQLMLEEERNQIAKIKNVQRSYNLSVGDALV